MIRALAVAALLALVAGCGPATTSPSATTAISPSAATLAPSSGASGLTVDVDPTLLQILPPQVGGAPMTPSPDTATEIASDPALAAAVEALAIGLAVSSGSSTDEDLVIASVVRLRQDVFSDAFFRSWRDSYDAAACERAGGVAGNAETEIDGRQVFIGSCKNGAFTYHTRYGEDVIVSVTSVGTARFGEQVMANLGS